MSRIVMIVAVAVLAAGCASSVQTRALQLPGEPARNGLQVPPDFGERPVQIATAPAR